MRSRISALGGKFQKIGTAVVLAAASAVATAQTSTGPDITAITDAAETVATIGGAVFLVMVGIKVFKWARRAL